MNDPAPHLAAEVEALKAAYAALNRNDVAGFVACFDPEIERVEPPEFPLGGTYRGLAAVTAHVAQGRGSWAEGSCEPERFVTAGDRVVVIIHVRVRLKTETEWREGRIADGFTFRAGKPVLFRTFAEERRGPRLGGDRRLLRLSRAKVTGPGFAPPDSNRLPAGLGA